MSLADTEKAETFSFLSKKVDPVFVPLMKRLVNETPEDVVSYCLAYFESLENGTEMSLQISTAHPTNHPNETINNQPTSPSSVTSEVRSKKSSTASRISTPRPQQAVGAWLRMITCNNVKTLENYARLATAVNEAKKYSQEQGYVVSTHINGDFLGNGAQTSLDHGRGFTQAMNAAQVDFACLGSYEVSLGFDTLSNRFMETDANVINSNMRHEVLTDNITPAYGVLHVGDKWGMVGGFLDDKHSTPQNKVNTFAAAAAANESSSDFDPCFKVKHQLYHHELSIDPIAFTSEEVWKDYSEELRHHNLLGKSETPAFYIPLTYQSLKQDEDLIESLLTMTENGSNSGTNNSKKAEDRMQKALFQNKIPVLFGGCDVETTSVKEVTKTSNVSGQVEDSCTLVKLGRDNDLIGVFDLWWDSEGQMQKEFDFIPLSQFRPDPKVQELIREIDSFSNKRFNVTLCDLQGGSEKSNEKQQQDALSLDDENVMIAKLLKYLKLGASKYKVDVAMLHGQSIKKFKQNLQKDKVNNGTQTKTDNSTSFLTIRALFESIELDTHQAVVRLPGWVISASIANSRKKKFSAMKNGANNKSYAKDDKDEESNNSCPYYLHCDSDCTIGLIDGSEAITFLDGKPFMSQQLYTVIIDRMLLEQVNIILPLNTYVKRNIELPPKEQCRPIKHIIIKGCLSEILNKTTKSEEIHGGNLYENPNEFDVALSAEMQFELNSLLRCLADKQENEHEFYLALEVFLTGHSSDHEHFHDDFLLDLDVLNNALADLSNMSKSFKESMMTSPASPSSSRKKNSGLNSGFSTSSSSLNNHIENSHQHHEAKQILQHVVGDGKEEWLRQSLGVNQVDEVDSIHFKFKHLHKTHTSLRSPGSIKEDGALLGSIREDGDMLMTNTNTTSVATIIEEGTEMWEIELNAKLNKKSS